jgi:hypothetical protein
VGRGGKSGRGEWSGLKNLINFMNMYAYPDSKCCYGYMTVCDACKEKYQASRSLRHVDFNVALVLPPATGKRQRCELCDKKFILLTAVGC